jgi:hypothetical protein
VYPSGADLATSAVATLPLAPTLFSTTIGCPRLSLTFGPTSRAMMSTGPPGGKATITRIGLEGYGCAMTSEEDSAKPIPTRSFFMFDLI